MTVNRIAHYLVWILAAALLIGTVGGFASFLTHSPGDSSSDAETRSNASALPPGITCLGYVDGEKGVASLTPTRPGCIAEVVVHEGEAVQAGAVLLRLDDRPACFAWKQARAAQDAAQVRLAQAQETLRLHPIRLAQQKAVLDAARARLAAARHLLTRKEELLKSRLVSAWEVAAAAEQVHEQEALCRAEQEKLAEWRLHDAELAVRSAESEAAASAARLQDAEYARDQCVLKAPEAGTVLRVRVSRGMMLNGGADQPAILFRPAGPPVVRAEVEQEFVDQVSVGQSAVVEDEFRTGVCWHGRVQRLADWHTQHRTLLQQPPRFTDVPTVECIIALDGPCPRLRLGQRVRVTIGKTIPCGG